MAKKFLVTTLVFALSAYMPLIQAEEEIVDETHAQEELACPLTQAIEEGGLEEGLEETEISQVAEATAEQDLEESGEAELTEEETVALLKETNPHLAQFIARSQEAQSLLETNPEFFRNWHMCMIDSVSHPKGTELTFFNSDLSTLTTARIAKNKADTSRGDWKKTTVLRKTDRNCRSSVKLDNKYIGYRDKFFGVLAEALLGLRKTYKGTILVDELYPLWNATLKDREELVDFVTYLQTNFEKQEKTPALKPVLFLKLANDPTLASVTEEDIALVSSVFQLVDPSDEKVAKAFNDIASKVTDTQMSFESSSKIRKPGRGMRQQIMDEVESFCADFDPKDATMKGAKWGSKTVIQGIILGSIVGIASTVAKARITNLLKKWKLMADS